MGVKLTKLKNLCEQYLEQNDFIMSVTSATELMEKYGWYVLVGELIHSDQAQAEKMMDKLQDLKDRNDEINETVMEGVEEDLADNEDILNEIDESNAEDAKKEAESALPSAPTTVHGGAVKKPTPAKLEKEEDLDGLLAELGWRVCFQILCSGGCEGAVERWCDEGKDESRGVERRRHDEKIYHWLNDNRGERVE